MRQQLLLANACNGYCLPARPVLQRVIMDIAAVVECGSTADGSLVYACRLHPSMTQHLSTAPTLPCRHNQPHPATRDPSEL
jgi:hypothetical protein